MVYFVHILLIFLAFYLSLRPTEVSPGWRGVKMAHVAFTIKNRNLLLSVTKRRHLQNVSKTKSCNYPRRFARYLYFIVMVARAITCPKPNNTRPHSQMSTKNWAGTTSYTDYTEKKANLDSQVQEITSAAFAICVPWWLLRFYSLLWRVLTYITSVA